MNPRLALWLSVALLVGAFIADLLTPESLVAAIMLTIPVALSSVFAKPRFTAWIMVAALAADAIAGWYNGSHVPGHFSAIPIVNRLLAAFSIVLVGVLGIVARAAAERSGRLAEQASMSVELGRKNDELAKANRLIDERIQVIRDIVYALSHDLRTPLSAAEMTMQQALEGKYGPLPESYREILRRSIESNSELRRLAETLLMVAKYESGEQSTQRGPVKLGALVRSVIDELDPLWRAKGISIVVGDDDAIAVGDTGEIRRAVTNLVANAISWTPEGGTIAVGVRCAGDSAVLSFEDTGYGVPATERGTLFQRLASRRAARPGSGSGLGLYIVRRIAESHGGSVSYRPIEPHGSEFSLTLPIYVSVAQHV